MYLKLNKLIGRGRPRGSGAAGVPLSKPRFSTQEPLGAPHKFIIKIRYLRLPDLVVLLLSIHFWMLPLEPRENFLLRCGITPALQINDALVS
jgi:hypothetical protein